MALSVLQVVVGLVVWVLFVLATIAGLFAGVGALLLSLPLQLLKLEGAKRLQRYASNNIHAADCAAAAFLGWDGRSTISKECGREILAGKPCTFCTFLCKTLHRVHDNHCEQEGADG